MAFARSPFDSIRSIARWSVLLAGGVGGVECGRDYNYCRENFSHVFLLAGKYAADGAFDVSTRGNSCLALSIN